MASIGSARILVVHVQDALVTADRKTEDHKADTVSYGALPQIRQQGQVSGKAISPSKAASFGSSVSL